MISLQEEDEQSEEKSKKFLWFVTSLPWLIPLGAVLAGLIALLRRHASGNSQRAARRAERRAARDAARAARKAAKNGEKPEE